MMTMFSTAIRQTLSTRARKFWFLALALATFGLIAYLPVRLTPGNDLAFQLTLFTARDFALFGALAALNALLIMMQVHIARERRAQKARLGAVAGVGSAGGFFAAAVGSLFGAASCASCVAAVFGFLGIGNVLFLLDHRAWVVGATLVLLAVAISFSARTISRRCASCVT